MFTIRIFIWHNLIEVLHGRVFSEVLSSLEDYFSIRHSRVIIDHRTNCDIQIYSQPRHDKESNENHQRKDGTRIKSVFLSQRERHILKTEKVLYIRSYITINKTIAKKELKKVYHR